MEEGLLLLLQKKAPNLGYLKEKGKRFPKRKRKKKKKGEKCPPPPKRERKEPSKKFRYARHKSPHIREKRKSEEAFL